MITTSSFFPDTKKIDTADLIKILNQPLLWKSAVSRSFCLQCQNLGEINLEYAHGLLQTMKILGNHPEIPLATPQDFRGYYFTTSYCESCNKNHTTVSVEFKEITKKGLN